jgi:heme oxygenase
LEDDYVDEKFDE